MCLLYHVYIVKYILLRLVVTLGWTVLYLLVATSYVLLVSCWLETALFVHCHLQLPVLPCGFSLLPSVVENLTGRTPRFTHFHASLCSYESCSLGIPGRPASM